MTVVKITGTRETNSLLFVLHGYTFGPQRKAMAPSEGEAMLAALNTEEDRLRNVEGLRMGDVAMAFQRLRDALAAPQPLSNPLGAPNREAIARIIFDGACGLKQWDNEFWREERNGCFAAADAILTLVPAEGGAREGWQPIETAPKDGSEIEVKYLTDDARRVRWSQSRCGIGWRLAHTAFTDLLNFDPTHWRPALSRPHSHPPEE